MINEAADMDVVTRAASKLFLFMGWVAPVPDHATPQVRRTYYIAAIGMPAAWLAHFFFIFFLRIGAYRCWHSSILFYYYVLGNAPQVVVNLAQLNLVNIVVISLAFFLFAAMTLYGTGTADQLEAQLEIEHAKNDFICKPQGSIIVKGKRAMDVWYVAGARNELSNSPA